MAVNLSIARKYQDIQDIPLVKDFYGIIEGVFLCTGPVVNLSTFMLNGTIVIGKPIFARTGQNEQDRITCQSPWRHETPKRETRHLCW